MRAQFAWGGARLAVVCIGLTLAAAAPAAVGTNEPELRTQAAALRRAEASIADRRQSALLQLYALESELQAARSDLGALSRARARVVQRYASTQRSLAVAERAATLSTRRLEQLLRRLYEAQAPDALEIVLSAGSLDEALSGLDSLDRAADAQRRILLRSRETRARLARVADQLAARKAELARLAEAAARRARELEAGAAAKARYVASLRRRQSLTTRQVTSLETAARAAHAEAAALQPAAPAAEAASLPAQVDAAVAPDGTRTLSVSAIGYSLRGRTATGLPVGRGIAAVDPGVIPLGTRMYVPGYGEAIAADTGGAIRGAVIDLWFPTVAEARAWGRRTVVISLG